MAELMRLAFEAKQVCDPLGDAAFNWQPEGGKAWSVGQCIDHLVRTNRLYLDALEEVVNRALAEGAVEAPPLDPGRIGRWFINILEPPVGIRLPAPKKALPASRLIRASTLIAFAGEQQRIVELVRRSARVDCNRLKFQNPLAGGVQMFNVATGLLVMAAHERRHLLQARNVCSRADFPRGS